MDKGAHQCVDCENFSESLFCDLKEKELETLDRHKTCNLYKKGQVLYHEGNRPLGLYCLKSGKVKIYKTGIDGREQIIRLVGPGDLFGYRSFLGEEFYSTSAAAIEDTSICFIDRNDFYQVLKSQEKLSLNLIQLLNKELSETENFVRDMAQKTVRERVAEILLLLKMKYGFESDQKTLGARLTREELANYVGTATETLIRLLSEMKEEDLIATKGRSIQIINEKKLLELANLDY